MVTDSPDALARRDDDSKLAAVRRGRSNKRKGAKGENELCSILSGELGTVVKRRLGQARDSGTDVHVGPFRIECKRVKEFKTLYKWMNQARGEGIPCVAVRADGEHWLVLMDLGAWVTLARGEL